MGGYFRPGLLLMKLGAMILMFCFAGMAMARNPDAKTPGRPQIRFTVENPKIEPAVYSLEINEDGSGRYAASAVDGPESQTAGRAIRVHGALVSQIFKVARAEHLFAKDCESRNEVAFTGKKTLAYSGPDGQGSCTFNYSRDEELNKAADKLMDVAYTLSEGARLRNEHLHDRLGLDAELGALQEAAKEDRAAELANIAPELKAIADDDAVMERARARARALLSEAERAR